MAGRFHNELPGRTKPDPEPGGPLGVADQVEVVAVELLDHLASDTRVCDQAKACGLCLLRVVENNDYAKAHAAWTAASLSLGIANFGPDVSLGMAAARFAVTTTAAAADATRSPSPANSSQGRCTATTATASTGARGAGAGPSPSATTTAVIWCAS